MDRYTIAHTKDEFGQDRWFVEDEHCDWVAGPYDTIELAADQARLMNAEPSDTGELTT